MCKVIVEINGDDVRVYSDDATLNVEVIDLNYERTQAAELDESNEYRPSWDKRTPAEYMYQVEQRLNHVTLGMFVID